MAPYENAKVLAGDSNILPRYTCPLFQIDCGGGFCCPVGQTCFNNGGQTTCRLPPGIPGSDQPASPAPGATTSSAAPSSSTSASSSTSSSSSSPTVATTTISSTSTATASAAASTSGGSISGSGIAGIVVGFVVLGAFVGASVWSLMRRRRKERERESTLLPEGRSGGSDGASAFLGGGGGGRSRSMQQQHSPQRVQSGYQNSSPPMSQFGGYGQQHQQSPVSRHSQQPSWGGNVKDNLVDMYAGSNVGKKPGEVPGRVEAMGDVPSVQPPLRAITRKKVGGGQSMGPVFEVEGSPVTRQAV